MSLPAGTRLGSYEIVAPLGAGGMGEVYRAKDTKLHRDVAIKVLPESFALDTDRVARFTREAQVLASLNHPNIAAIYGLEDVRSGGPSGPVSHALVMELVEGEDLSAVIARGAMPLADALPVARQIADALEAAHERGIVHRDLKPQNVKVTADGTVKVLDFGLAKPVDASTASSTDLANSPTMTSPAMTGMGMILGTAAYMAPEQAKGRAVDRRADIWAFGAVLYEMLTGARAFKGEDVSDLLVSVLRDAPDFAALPATVPPSVRRLLRRCLEKDPRKRLSAAGDARLELDEAGEASPPPAQAGPPRRGAMAIGAVVLAVLAAAVAWYAKPQAPLPVRLLELPAFIAADQKFALSPDGTRVAYAASGRLYVRALDAVTPRDLGPLSTDTNDAVTVFNGVLFWSPDSTTIGFSSDREIRTVPAAGGPVFAVGRIPATGVAIAAQWLRDNTIVFAVWRESIYTVPATGGTPVVDVAIDQATEIDAHSIVEAPSGRLIVTIHQRTGDKSATVLVGHGAAVPKARVLLTEDQTLAIVRWVEPGELLFVRQGTNQGLWRVPFTNGPIDVTKATLIQAGAVAANVADDGSAIFLLEPRANAAPVWVDLAGAISGVAGGPVPDAGRGFALSPDGRRLAMITGGEAAVGLGDSDTILTVRDVTTGSDTRLPARAAAGDTSGRSLIDSVQWFPSGDRLLISAGEVEAGGLFEQRPDVVAAPRLLVSDLTLGRVGGNGRTLVAIQDERGRFHLMHALIAADGAVGTPQRVMPGDDREVRDFDVSPDGRFVVYAVRSAMTGPSELVLSELPIARNQWPIAANATRPRFSPDGTHILYIQNGVDAARQATATVMSRAMTNAAAGTLGLPTKLFDGAGAALMAQRGYDVAPDGRRFVTLQDAAPAPGEGRRLVWMQNWPAAVGKR